MDKEQIKAISESIPMEQRFSVEQIVSAAIESYKAELLKEVGEPVLYAEFAEDGGWLGDASEYAYHLEEPHALFTSDQVAAAIIKATKPLEDEVKAANSECELFRKNGRIVDANKIVELRTQLAAAQEEIKTVTEQKNRMWFEMQTAQDQLAKAEQLWQVAKGRCDGLEEKLAKAEQRVSEYNKLIYAVQTKNPDETRHQTALRYIRNAENRPSNTAANGASS